MSDYDRRQGASPNINRLTPTAAMAAEEFKQGVDLIMKAYNLLGLIEREALSQVPGDYRGKHWGRPHPAEKFVMVADYAADLRRQLDEHKPFNLRDLVKLFEELASETKAHMGE
jgi:hypothetical protein